MDNEINLFDMLLAKKLGGGGGAQIEKIEYTATGWNELPAFPNIAQYFPLNIDSTANYALGTLTFTISGMSIDVPVHINKNVLLGGSSSISGYGATICLQYDSVDEEWSVSNAWTNLMGSWTDITSAVQIGASDIVLMLFK